METYITLAKPNGEEQGCLSDVADVDIDIGGSNDFEIRIASEKYEKERMNFGCRFFIPGTEYGGIIRDIESITKTGEIVLRGSTWCGMLEQKVIEPPDGEDHLIVSGDLNEVIKILAEKRFDELFQISNLSTGIKVTNWKVDRYVTLYDALQKLMDYFEKRLKIQYIQPEGNEYGYVLIQAEEVQNYSEQLEYSQEENIHVDVRDNRNGVNHLVCAGKGENQERVVLHLYVQKDGTVGKTQHYKGLEEIASVYDYSSADVEKLEEDGKKKLIELKNYKKCEMTVDDIDVEIGDIISGYDAITNTQVVKPIIQKVLKIQDGTLSIDYKVKGDD